MATMNVSLPGQMKNWVEHQAQSGRYSNSSDYVRDLIRRDQMRQDKIAHIQELVTESLESGICNLTQDEIMDEARRSAAG